MIRPHAGLVVSVAGFAALVGACTGSVEPVQPDVAVDSTQGIEAPGVAREILARPPVVCVEPGRYAADADVVADRANGGRLWQRAVDPVLRTQPDALAYCASLTLGARTGWRAPTVQELATLRLHPAGLGRPDACYPSIDQEAFPETPMAEFWTSTTRPNGDGLYTGFDDGRTHPAPLDAPFHVRCVHDPDRPADPPAAPVR
jgi:hypothetical protein